MEQQTLDDMTQRFCREFMIPPSPGYLVKQGLYNKVRIEVISNSGKLAKDFLVKHGIKDDRIVVSYTITYPNCIPGAVAIHLRDDFKGTPVSYIEGKVIPEELSCMPKNGKKKQYGKRG